MGGYVVQDPTDQNSIKLIVRLAEKRWWFKSNHQRVRNYSAWIVLRNDNPVIKK
jgi:hypothetical protein